eukprot:1579964-Prymnesium_polylepis.1
MHEKVCQCPGPSPARAHSSTAEMRATFVQRKTAAWLRRVWQGSSPVTKGNPLRTHNTKLRAQPGVRPRSPRAGRPVPWQHGGVRSAPSPAEAESTVCGLQRTSPPMCGAGR